MQTASTLTISTAENKGQAWLATRASSTSLADISGPAPTDRSDVYVADDEFSPVSYRYASRPQSRFGSRAVSRVASRRGSRGGFMTPVGSTKTPGGERLEETSSYFDSMSPDFVDTFEDDDDDDDEDVIIDDDGEMKRLVWGRAKGWVDWAVGWMDFREDADGDDDEDGAEEEAAETPTPGKDQTGSTKTGQALNKKKRARIQRPQEIPAEQHADVVAPAPNEPGFIGDAAWLIGLAKHSLA